MKVQAYYVVLMILLTSLFVLLRIRVVYAAEKNVHVVYNVSTSRLSKDLMISKSGSVLSGSANFRRHAILNTSLKKTYSSSEAVVVSLDNPDNNQLQLTVTSNAGEHVPVDMTQQTQDGTTTFTLTSSQQMKPGKYAVQVTGSGGENIKQDFTWGVLAINTNKSVYAPHEKAKIQMAVLDENGAMVCNAKVKLQIRRSDATQVDVLSTDSKQIVINSQCYTHDFTIEPDYETSYDIGEAGKYIMTLSAVTQNGTYTITDSFLVQKNVPFDVERTTTTRIYPPLTYPVKFTVKANQDFDGIVKERVPRKFVVTSFAVNSQVTDTMIQAHEADRQQTADEPPAPPPPPVTSKEPPYVVNATKEASAPAEPVISPLEVTPTPATNSANTTVPHLRYPFNGDYPETQGFGLMPDDQLLALKYRSFGVTGHDGMDFGLPMKTPVVAADNGVIISAGPGAYGTTVIIQHTWGRTYYGHLSSVSVHADQVVNQGEEIGLSGNTGLSSGPHLHFGLRPNQYDPKNGYFGKVDPLIYLTGISHTDMQGVTTNDAPAFTSPPTTDNSEISIPVHIHKGDTITLEYQYQAPQVSPQFYLLGPLEFVTDDNTVVFEEARQWQIAADAVWYNSSWSYRKAITIDHTKVPNTDQSSFPVLISLASDSDLKARARTDGFDILFTSSDGSTKLPSERALYTNSTGQYIAWVNVPTVSHTTDTIIYMYYGNSSACDQTLNTCDGTNNSQTVWSNYGGVFHLDQDPSGNVENDSTSNGLNLGPWSGVPISSSNWITGAVYKAIALGNGSTANMTMYHSDNAALRATGDMTIQGWFSSPTTGSEQIIVYKNLTVDPWQNYNLYKVSGNLFQFVWCTSGPPTACDLPTGTTTTSTNTWYHVAGVRSGTTDAIYVNGTQEGSSTLSGSNPSTGGSDFLLGEVYDARPQTNLDEIRFRPSALTGDWLKTEYNNQNSPSTFYSLGAQDCYPGNYPAMSFIMRHGKYFSVCGEHAFVF